MNKHHLKAKTEGTLYGIVHSVKYGKLSCYESPVCGEDYPIIIFAENGDDVTGEFEAWDMDTVRHLADD